MTALVRTAIDNRGVVRLTIDRAAKANALSSVLMRELVASFQAVSADAGLRAVVLASAGDRAFIGGADVGEMAALDMGSARSLITLVHETCQAARDCPVPVIARIQGHVLGAGLELAAACDLRVASTRAMFGMPEVQIGLPSVVEAALLPRLIGAGRARWLLMTGANIDAEHALQWGLIEQAVAADALDGAIGALVDRLVANGPQAMRAQKRLIRMWEDTPLDQAVARSIEVFAQHFACDEPTRMLRASAARR